MLHGYAALVANAFVQAHHGSMHTLACHGDTASPGMDLCRQQHVAWRARTARNPWRLCSTQFKKINNY
jgi:hypothetical protein